MKSTIIYKWKEASIDNVTPVTISTIKQTANREPKFYRWLILLGCGEFIKYE